MTQRSLHWSTVAGLTFLTPALALTMGVSECSSPDDDLDGYTVSEGDCNDADAQVHPGAAEICNFRDEDCDGRIDNGAGVVAVDGGSFHSLALCPDGTVWAWGDNAYGQLGDGTDTGRSSPVKVTGLATAVAVSAGNEHSMALLKDGTVWAWGGNYSGELGTGDKAWSRVPVPVKGLAKVTHISAGTLFSLAVTGDGKVWAWGDNTYGQYGAGSVGASLVPLVNPTLSGVRSAEAGGYYSLFLLSDGTVWGAGYNKYGQLGVGDGMTYYNKPVQAKGYTAGTKVAAGFRYSLALQQLPGLSTLNTFLSGYGCDLSGNCSYLFELQDPSMMTSIASGEFHVMASSSTTVFTKGDGYYGQLGDGTSSYSDEWVKVVGLPSGASMVSAGDSHSLALLPDGTVWSWGLNESGQLGDGSITNRPMPVQVKVF